jgi:hypothetical protein
MLVTWGLAALITIWTSVVVISVFAPDNVSGTQHEHVPVAAILTWIWGLIASRAMIATLIRYRDRPDLGHELRLLAAAVMLVWIAGAVVGGFGPEMVTGTDPTRVPIAALLAPIAAMVMTTTACQLFSSITSTGDGK